MRFSILLAAALVMTIPAIADAQKKKGEGIVWTPANMMQIKRVTGVQVNPDNTKIVYTVKQAVMTEGKSEYVSHIYRATGGGDNPILLTKGIDWSDNPQWSPDGKWIAFVSKKSAKRNVWVLSATSKGGDAVQVTDVKTGVTSFKWSPDSAWIAYTATDGPTEAEEKAKKDKNDVRVVDENYKMSRLYIVSLPAAGKKDERLLTDGAFNVPATGRAGYDWSPDSKSIVYTHTKTPLADDWTSADLQIVDIEKKNSRMLLESGPVRYSPHFSPDGKSIAFVAGQRSWAGTGVVHVHALGDKTSLPLAETFDRWGRYSEIVGWSADSDAIYFTEVKGTTTYFGTLTLDKQVMVIQGHGFASDGIHLNASRKRLGMTWETVREVNEAAVSGTSDFKPSRASRVNAKYPILPPDQTTPITWKSKDGLEIEGLLTYPANCKEGERYPLLLVIHGGPMGVFTQTYPGSPNVYPVGAFSSRGYFVLRANPRGSSGYGKKFRYANYGDWGGGDYQDLMAGVDHLIKLGHVDENRLGVMGWSYGGFMTSWIVTQTKRFKAASCGAGVTNLMSFTGTSDIPSFLPDYFGGEFWNKLDAYYSHSAMFKVKGVTTPTLIQHGERDERVPLSQGLEFYNALKRQGCTTKMVIYPRTPHGIEEPRLLLDCMERNLEWFDRYVKNAK